MRAKPLLAAGHIQFLDRQKNLETLGRLGITRQHQIEILEGLTPAHYFNTAPPTSGGADEAWEFGVVVKGEGMYIKLEIVSDDDEEMVLCWSFHVAERPIIYPYKG